MRKSLWIIPVLLLSAAIGAPSAHADTFAISFLGTNAPTVVGSDLLTYDPTTMMFTTPSIEVLYLGTTYTLNRIVNTFPDPPSADTWLWDSESATGRIAVFDFTQATDVAYNIFNTTVPDATGGVSLSAVSTPEAGTLSLMLIGLGSLGLVLVMRKRIAQGLPQAT